MKFLVLLNGYVNDNCDTLDEALRSYDALKPASSAKEVISIIGIEIRGDKIETIQNYVRMFVVAGGKWVTWEEYKKNHPEVEP